MTEISELLPCPFSGLPGRLMVADRGKGRKHCAVRCERDDDDCYCHGSPLFDTEAEAIAAWNRRAPAGKVEHWLEKLSRIRYMDDLSDRDIDNLIDTLRAAIAADRDAKVEEAVARLRVVLTELSDHAPWGGPEEDHVRWMMNLAYGALQPDGHPDREEADKLYELHIRARRSTP